MTLDEAILHCENVAHDNDLFAKQYDDASGYTRSGKAAIRIKEAKKCEACANDHRQLAEWLKDYKRLKEQEPCDDAISRKDTCTAIIKRLGIKDETFLLEAERAIYQQILAMPPVAPQQKIGRWIAYEVRLPDRTILNYRCSVCGRKLIGYNTETLSEAPFCHCGAKMQEVENG